MLFINMSTELPEFRAEGAIPSRSPVSAIPSSPPLILPLSASTAIPL